jgi:hypothetical protein
LFVSLILNNDCFATENNFANWTGAVFQGKLSKKWGWQAELQTRLNDGTSAFGINDPLLTRGNKMLIRLSGRWLPRGDGTLQFSLGYAWAPNFSPQRNENRLWQQSLLQSDADEWWWMLRFRTEERWIEQTSGVSLRLRHFSRIHRYLTNEHKWGISLWNEIFFNLNSVTGGPLSGFDQNRIFLGPHIVLNPNTRTEFGYLNLVSAQGTARDVLISHILALYFYLDL